ncbi:LacI family DNA-binding transcriptional regulator [Pseudomonas sp. DOAB1069]|uniref:LacI family DNA-binding transcriptional regulator n=1 Tax=Pseudomonas folii TaxID=2762593 RepID=A0ABR7B206_9PSED|nr:LacI family DNA-binding transcriptional regulator [Pseudomonas folii]
MGTLRITEIASQTGLSIATVSRVLAGKSNTSAAARQKVLAVARQRGVMEDLANGRFLLNGLTIFAPSRAFNVRSDIFYYKVIQGITQAVAQHDVRVRYCELEEVDSDASLFLEKMNQKETDAAILIGIDDPHIHQLAADLSKPAVLINCIDRSMRLPSISPDHLLIGQFAINYLFQMGHRNVLTLQCLRRYTMDLRMRGIRDAWKEQNLEFVDANHQIITEGFGSAEAEARVAAFIADCAPDDRPTAILAGGDFMAAGAVKALQSAGLKVPQDVSVMSMDGFNLADINDIPLTTLHVPRDELGAEAIRVLRQRLFEPRSPCGNLLLGGQLITGSSVRRIKHSAKQTPVYQKIIYD